METYLVTGGAGFIGSHIVDALVNKNYRVIVVDNLSTGNKENINRKAIFYEQDIRSDLSEIFIKYNIDYVIHHAAQIDVQKSLNNPSIDSDINITGSINILSYAAKYNVKKVIYASSAAVYGKPDYLGLDEEHSVNPISYYGISKHTPEHYLKVFNELYNLDYTILRYSNAYGIRQEPKGEGGVISIFIDKCLKKEKLTVFGDGEQTRDFIYVDDIVQANLLAINNGDNEIINISCNTKTSINELIEIIRSLLDYSIDVEYQSVREGDIKDSYLDNTKAKRILSWKPSYDLKTGLKKTIKYYKNL